MVSSIRRAAFAALCLSLSVACGGGIKGPTTCSTLADCKSGQVCQGGECLSPGQCTSDQTSCTNDNDCPAKNFCKSGCCNPVSGCATDADCSGATPHCDSGTHSCKACVSNSQCPAGNLCTPGGLCGLGCGSNADCSSPTPACHTFPGGVTTCSQCDTSRDCRDATKPTCSSGTCTGCNTDAECAKPTAACDAPRHTCVICTDAENVTGVNPNCPATAQACLNEGCVLCNAAANGSDTKNGACPAATPVCTSSSTCVACVPANNKGTTGANPACAAATPTCGADNTCVACTVDSQCSAAGDYCGGDRTCHTPVLTTITAASATVQATGLTGVSAALDHPARVATTITFTLLDGPGSFSATGAVLTTTTATIAVGETSTPAGNAAGAVTFYANTNTTGTAHVQASSNGVMLTTPIAVTDVPATLTGFSADKTTLQVGATATLTATLSAAPINTATVTINDPSPAVGTLPATLDFHQTDHASATFTAVAVGTDIVSATYSGVTLPNPAITMTVFDVAGQSITPATSSVATGASVPMVLTVASLPPADATITVTLSGPGTFTGPGTVAGQTSAVLKIPSGTTTANFTVLASSTTAGTITVTADAASATITVNPQLASVTVSPTPAIVGQPSTVTVTLTAAPKATTRVYLNDYNPGFATAFKLNAYLPSYIDIAAGSATGTATFNECKSLPPTNTDTIGIGAWLPGANEVEAAPLLVCPLGSGASDVPVIAPPGGCPDTSTMTAALCAVYPIKIDEPMSTPLMATLALAYKKPVGATNGSVPITFAFSPAGCASATQVIASVKTAITGVTLTEFATASGNSNSRTTANFTLVPGATTGPCTFTVSTTATGVSPATQSSTLNIVANSTAAAPGDLYLNKVEYDEGTNDVGEYVEIFNPTGAVVDLTPYTLVLVGSPSAAIGPTTGYFDDRLTGKSEYSSVPLKNMTAGVSTLPVAGYLEVTDNATIAGITASATVLVEKLLVYKLPTTAPANEAIEDAPSAVFLVKNGQIIDGISWGGPIINATSPTINGGVAFSWPLTGHPLENYVLDQFATATNGLAGSLVRIATSGDNSLDWRFSTTVTPGAPNTTVTGP